MRDTGGWTRRSALGGLGAGLLAAAGCAPRTDVRAAGGIIVGSSATGVPFSFLDVETNRLTGAMIDIVEAMAAQAQTPAAFQVVPFSALIPSLTARKIDMIAAAMLRTPERERVVAFSDPVYAYGGGLVVGADHLRDYARLEDLRGLKVGAQVGSRFVDQLKAAGVADVKTYDGLSDILRDVRLKRLDVAYGDEPILRYYLRVTRSKVLRLVESFKPTALEDVCLILRKDDRALLERVNAAIAGIRGSTLPPILAKWGL
jgi:polar amino acid transport system substrate-binding protein